MVSKDKAVLSSILLFMMLTNRAEPFNQYKSIHEALEHGDPSINFRARQEYATQEQLASATAYTVKSQLGYQSANFYKSNLLLEMVNVTSFFGQKYNPNSYPLQKPNYTIINDPKGTGITNANISSEYLPNTEIILGRQNISLDNSRMVGNDLFRQFPTSFDAITIKNNFLDDFDIFYSFATHINTSNNNSLSSDGRRQLRANLLNITWQNFTYGQIIGYIYNNNDLTILSNSNTTFGSRVISDHTFRQIFKFDYELEIAGQKNNSNNPNKYSALYFNAGIWKDSEDLFKNWLLTGKLGYELLGSHSTTQSGYSFCFPLGALHEFNGLAEGYSKTPIRGLRDYYASIKAEYLECLDLIGVLHLFQFAKGARNQFAGMEIDLSASFRITKNLTSELIFAKLNAKNQLNSIRRFSASVSYSAM